MIIAYCLKIDDWALAKTNKIVGVLIIIKYNLKKNFIIVKQ